MVNYLGGEFGEQFDHEVAELVSHDAPAVDGFTFLRWEFVGGRLDAGIKLQPVYQINGEDRPAEVTVGDYTMQRRGDANEYIIK